MSTPREKLLAQFRELVVERLEKIARQLMKLEGAPDVEAGKATLRELHGLKGEARMMGFAEINSLVHLMEDLVRAAEKGGYALNAASTDALLVASDAVTVLAGAAPAPATPLDLNRLLAWLKQRTDAERGVAPAGSAAPGTAEAPAPGTGSRPALVNSGSQVDVPSPSPSAPGSSSRSSATEARVDGSTRITQASLETLTTAVTGLLQRNRRRDLAAQRQLVLSRELQHLHRLAEDLGPSASALASRLARVKETAAELHRDGKLIANEELRDLTHLSDEVQALRMMPLSVLFEPYARMVRELARELGKEVELTVEGDDTRVDRSVLDALKEPLMHLVRNSLDHGLETRAARLEHGKPPRGRLVLRAQREGERLLLRVEDDGVGLDPEKLKQVAVRRGLLDEAAAERLTAAAAQELIFIAGFSSKEQVTDVSGRGVGLDVVRVRMLGLGGEVTVTSQIGKGSAFELRVPVSLTELPLLFIRVGDERLCLTAASVDHAITVEPAQLRELAGRPALNLGDVLMPFASISSILGAAPERAAHAGELVLVVRGHGHSAAIGVDQVLEERVQAVLPLKGALSRFSHLSGATSLADGTLAMVLSAAHLVATARGQQVALSGSERAATALRRRILVVDDSPLTRELLCSLLEAVGYDIVSASDGQDALDRLAREPVDLVVSDLEMPRVDGLELTRRLKSHPTLSRLPVVIVTTRGSELDRQRGMEAGADGYITKNDLVRQDLVDVVSRLLA